MTEVGYRQGVTEVDANVEPNEPSASGADAAEHVRGALHDVSNALTVLLGWVAEAQGEGRAPDEIRAALREVEAHARRARDLARAAVGGTPVAPAVASCDAVIQEVLSGLAMAARAAGVGFAREGRAVQSSVTEATALHHVLVNLLLNALAFAPRGSVVTVAAEDTPEALELEVRDQGPGVAEALRAGVFGGASGREGGAGVGLAHARRLARAAGGDLALLPTRGGASFRLTWPRCDPTPRPRGPRARGAGALTGLRVVVVEDDPAVLSLLEAALGARGADVVLVPSRGELGRALAVPHDGAIIDLSPLDGHLPEELARIAAAARPGARIVVASGSVDRLPATLTASGNVQLVRKPFELAEVLAALGQPT